MIERKCVICGKLFSCYPSDNRVTCSNECRRERQRRQVTARPVKWGEEAKKRLSANGQTKNLKAGTPAAQKSPIAGRFETNQEAKIWTLIDPSGNRVIVRNLLLWARAHTHLFGKPPGDKSAKQILSGFAAIAQTLKGNRGAPGKRPGASTYFGWSMLDLPKEPDDLPTAEEKEEQK